jgi:glycosyltransferase involved in cell wall biosynthesis
MFEFDNSLTARPSVSTRKPQPETPARAARLKILILRVRLLAPQNTGNRIRTARMIEQLSKENDVTVVTYSYPTDTDDDDRQTRKLCKRLVVVPYSEAPKQTWRFYGELALNLFQRFPYIITKYASRAMAESVAQAYEEERPDLVMCDYLQSCEGLRRLPGVPFVLFEHNVEASLFEQFAERGKSALERAYLRLQARRLRRYEQAQCRKAAHVIAVSEVDREAYLRDYGVSRCSVIPTGVDIQHFRPSTVPCRANNLVFAGAMDWMANQDAMKYFVAEVFPLIRKEMPSAVFTIVGRNAPSDILALGETPGVHVTNTVKDIRPYVHGSKVFVVPLRIGSGTRLKLLEAMAMGKAIVSTTLGAEGLPLEHNRHIVLADGPEAFAEEVLALLRDPARRAQLQRNARELAEREYSWERVGRLFNEICHQAATTARGS